MNEMLLAANPPDVLIRPAVRSIGLLDNIDPFQVARLGEEAAEKVMPELNQVVTWQAGVRRRIHRMFHPPFPLPYSTVEI